MSMGQPRYFYIGRPHKHFSEWVSKIVRLFSTPILTAWRFANREQQWRRLFTRQCRRQHPTGLGSATEDLGRATVVKCRRTLAQVTVRAVAHVRGSCALFDVTLQRESRWTHLHANRMFAWRVSQRLPNEFRRCRFSPVGKFGGNRLGGNARAVRFSRGRCCDVDADFWLIGVFSLFAKLMCSRWLLIRLNDRMMWPLTQLFYESFENNFAILQSGFR